MKVTKYQLCSSCRKIRPVMSNGELGMSIEELLDSNGYNSPLGYTMGNQMALLYLQENGGCSSCISLFRCATNQSQVK
jgi:hypothetical protein